MIDLKKNLQVAIEASYEAGEEILRIYQSKDFMIESKEDKSPLTLADKLAHEKIISKLSTTGFPILSEEGKEITYDKRKSWEYFWMVDPLDGTKEFIKKNGEFTVNIALIYKGKSILGVVYAPVLKCLYYGNISNGSFKIIDKSMPVKLSITSQKEIKTIVASRSHMNQETLEFINQYPNTEIISMGSSLKFMLVAENKAQLYPRFAPTMEWDTAAAQAIIEAAGGKVLTYPDKLPLMYNRENMLNGWFLVC